MNARTSCDPQTVTESPLGWSADIRRRCENEPRDAARFALHRADRAFDLCDGDTTIGRSEDATIVIDSLAVSRMHAKIVISGDRITIFDLGSRNGTFVGERQVDTSMEIADGVEIRLGPIWFILRSSARSV